MVETLLGLIAGLLLGLVPGFMLGRVSRQYHPWRYWALNLLALGLGTIANLIGFTQSARWLAVASIVFIAAAFTGLKYGRGTIVGSGSLDGPPLPDPHEPVLWDED